MKVKDRIIENLKEVFPSYKMEELVEAILSHKNKKSIRDKYCKALSKRRFLLLYYFIYRAYKTAKKEDLEGFYIQKGTDEGIPWGAEKVEVLKTLKFKGHTFVLHKENISYIVSEFTTGFMIANSFSRKIVTKVALIKLKEGYDFWVPAIKKRIKINTI